MQDIDFQELDKAVNSMMQTQKQTPAKPSVSVTSPAASVVVPAPTPQPKPTFSTPKLMVGRPTSRLANSGMVDIMAPKSPNAKLEPTKLKTPSRIAQDIRPPVSVAKTAMPTPSAPIVSTPTPTPPVQSTPPIPFETVPLKAPQELPVLAEPHWPDPLEVTEPRQEIKEESPSPFIPGAKVEKRPLGAFAAEAAAISKVEDELASPTSYTPPSLAPAAEYEETVKPSASPAQVSLHNDSATMAIPQQYQTVQRAADDAARPIFDTTQYHTPLLEATAKPHRKMKLWLRLLIGCGALAACAVLGYILYSQLTAR